jgi:hypothetical protein
MKSTKVKNDGWFANMRIVLLLVIFGGQSWLADAGQVIDVQGHYVKTLYRYGKPTSKSLRVTFSITLSTNACGIWATNMDDTSVWETVIYDGTNTYLLTPIAGHSPEAGGRAILCGLVNPGRQYYTMGISFLDTYIPWITYCLLPSDVTPDMHSPAANWRSNVNTYGWRWTNVVASPDGRFLQGFVIVRDSSLDLNGQNELLRTNLEYPRTIDDFQNQNQYLAYRNSIPDGWVTAKYACKQWYETNGYTIPLSAEFESYAYTGGKTLISSSRIIQADKITVSEENTASAPPLAEKTYVRDYRYTRRSENRMFPYAEYVGSGSWKPDNDPELLAQANHYMKYGPKFGDFGVVSKYFSPQGGRLIVIWLSLLLVNAIVIVILVRNKLKQTHK